MSIDLDILADHAWIETKSALPVRIRDYGDRRRVRTVILREQRSAKKRVQPEPTKKIAGDEKSPCVMTLSPRNDRQLRMSEPDQI